MRRRLAALTLSAAFAPAQGLTHTRALAAITSPGETVALTGHDVDADGQADLVVAGRDGVVWYRGVGRGEFGAARTLEVAGVALTLGLAGDLRGLPSFADVDGDGVADLVVVALPDAPLTSDGRVSGSPSAPTLRWCRGLGGGGFGADSSVLGDDGEPRRLPDGATALALADWDGDGRPDLFVAARGEVAWYRGDEAGFARTGVGLANAVHDVAVCDFDGDGDLDLLTSDGVASVWLRENSGRKTAPVLAPPVALVCVAGADVLAFAVLPQAQGAPIVVTASRQDTEVLPPAGLTPEETVQLELAEALVAQTEAKLRKLAEIKPADFTSQTLRARKELRAEMESWVARPRQVARALRRKQEPVPAPFRFAVHER